LSARHKFVFAGRYEYSEGLLKQKGEFFVGNINELLELIKKPTLFIVEDIDILKEIISESILKKKLNSNFFNLKYINFYSEDSIKVLVDISLNKLKNNKKRQIVRPLYIQKPNITYSKKK